MGDNSGVVIAAVAAGTGMLAFVGGRWDARRTAKQQQRDQLRLDVADLEKKVARAELERDNALERLAMMTKALRDAERVNDLLSSGLREKA